MKPPNVPKVLHGVTRPVPRVREGKLGFPPLCMASTVSQGAQLSRDQALTAVAND
jgi:hypothetical protein